MSKQRFRQPMFDVGYATDAGSRGHQEDNLGFRQYDDGSVLAVLADGMGGHTGGAVASELAVAWFGEQFPQTQGSIAERLVATLHHTQQRLCHYAHENPGLQDMGSTLVAVFVQGTALHWVSVGDSLLYHVTADSEVKQLNAIHTVAQRFQRLWEHGKISHNEFEQVQQPHALTSALGVDKFQEVDSGQIAFPTGTQLILASDGLLSVTPADIHHWLDQSANAKTLAERLLMAVLAKRQQGQDNVSLIILQHLPARSTQRRYPWLAVLLGATVLFGASAGLLYQWYQAEQHATQERQARLVAEQQALHDRQAYEKEAYQRKLAEQDAQASKDLADAEAKKAATAEKKRKQAEQAEKRAKERADAVAQRAAQVAAKPPPPALPKPVETQPPKQVSPSVSPAPVPELGKHEILPES